MCRPEANYRLLVIAAQAGNQGFSRRGGPEPVLSQSKDVRRPLDSANARMTKLLFARSANLGAWEINSK